jgi:hypothetical protein
VVPVVVLAGLSVPAFDAVRRVSSNRFAPDGELLSTPVSRPGYPAHQARKYLSDIFAKLIKLPEDQRVGVTLLYVDYGDHSTKDFVRAFFPFALPRAISPFSVPSGIGKQELAAAQRRYVEYISAEAQELRQRAYLVKEQLDVYNLTPLLLPSENFRSPHLHNLLEGIFWSAGLSSDLPVLLKNATSEFKRHHPRVYPPEDNRSCFSDGSLFFRSPGKHRHGFFRHLAVQGHVEACLINARSRLGSSYDYRFHYDCVAAHRLANAYPNCHSVGMPPKPTHVNIAPNDYII